MSTLAIDIKIPVAESVSVTDDTLSVNLSDGRTILVPTAWYPRLLHATRSAPPDAVNGLEKRFQLRVAKGKVRQDGHGAEREINSGCPQ